MDRPLRSLNRMTGPSWAVIIALGISLGSVLIGCSTAANRVLPVSLEDRVKSDGRIDDHMAAAALYQHEAQRLDAEAQKYAEEAAAIKPLEDTKGFRRNALLRTAQNLREKAREMQQLYADHAMKAETMTGMQPRH